MIRYMAMPTTVQPLWDALQQEVIGIHFYWINYRQLFGKSKERIDLLNDCAGEFFFIIQDALLTDVQLSLCKLADPARTSGRANATLDRLLNEIAALNIPQLTGDILKCFQRYRACCQSIQVRRNKELAHADLGALLKRYGSPAGSVPIPGPSRQEIEDALASLREFMNAIDVRFTGSAMAYEHFRSLNDGESLVWVLKQGVRYGELSEAGELPFDDLKKLTHYDA
jgi:hypothetical protein